MKYSLRTRQFDFSEDDHNLLSKKLERLEKFVTPPFHTDVNLSHITHHHKGGTFECKINVEQNGRVFHTSRTSDTISDAIDEAIHALRRELKKHKDIKAQQRLDEQRQ